MDISETGREDEASARMRKAALQTHAKAFVDPKQKPQLPSLLSEVSMTDGTRRNKDVGPGWKPSREEERRALVDAIEKGRSELDRIQSRLNATRSQVMSMEDKVRRVESGRDEAYAEQTVVSQKISVVEEKRASVVHRKKLIESNIQEMACNKRELEKSIAEKKEYLEKEEGSLAISQRRLDEATIALKSMINDNSFLDGEIKATSEKYQKQQLSNAEMGHSNAEKSLASAAIKKEVKEVASDIVTMKRQKSLVTDKIRKVDKDRMKNEAEVDKLKLEISKIRDSDVKLARKEDESQRLQMDGLNREKVILQRNFDSSTQNSNIIYDLIKVNETAGKHLDNELEAILVAVNRHRNTIVKLTDEHKRHNEQAHQINCRREGAFEGLLEQESMVAQLLKKVCEAETRLKQKQNIFKNTRINCHVQSRELAQSQEEVGRLRHRLKFLERQRTQLKDEIGRTHEHIFNEHYRHFHADGESKTLKRDIANLYEEISKTEHALRDNDCTMKCLTRTIKSRDEVIAKLKTEHSTIVSDRDISCAHLIQKRDDLDNVKKIIKTQKSALHHAEAIRQWQEDRITLISNEIKILQDEKLTIDKGMISRRDILIRKEVLEREMLKEKAKREILLQELGTPINIHRWRYLECIDPDRFALVYRAHSIQRKVLYVAQAISEKGALVEEVEAKLIETKNTKDSAQTSEDLKQRLECFAMTLKTKNGEIEKLNLEIVLGRRKMNALHQKVASLNDTVKSLQSN